MEEAAMSTEAQGEPKAAEEAQKPADTAPEATSTLNKQQVPTETLPTTRVSLEKQFCLLLAYASASSQKNRGAVTPAEAADLVKIHPSTASLANAFFISVGFLKREGRGLVPHDDLFAYMTATNWQAQNPGENPAKKLRSIVRETWFAREVIPKLLMGPLPQAELITQIAIRCNATSEYSGQLVNLIGYMETVGLIEKQGEKYQMVMEAIGDSPIAKPHELEEPKKDKPAPEDDKSHVVVKMGEIEMLDLGYFKEIDDEIMQIMWNRLVVKVKEKFPSLTMPKDGGAT